MIYTPEQIKIENQEYKFLQKLNNILSINLQEFNTKYSNSLKYINYLTLPIIMASIEDKAYNPFSEIIEKHISFIVDKKMEENGYKVLPLGYSSDLTYENDENIVNIDIKTANIENPADFSNEIALGFNQTNYLAKLPSGIKGKRNYNKSGIEEVKTTPNIPSKYKLGQKTKLNLTYGLIFIYPEISTIIDEIRNDYLIIRKLFDNILIKLYFTAFSGDINSFQDFLDYKPNKEKIIRKEIIIDNLIRANYIHRIKNIKLTQIEEKQLFNFNEHLQKISKKIAKSEIKPIAIISISIPNGLLIPHYDNEIVSGKSWGKSIRYHYNDGIFKGLQGEKSRVIFIYYNNEYLDRLKNHFKNIICYSIKETKI
jgi:hypothetical protein